MQWRTQTPCYFLAVYISLKPVKRTPLRLAYAGITLTALLALLPTERALGHVDLRPRLVESGVDTVLRIELPQLRAGPPPVRLEVDGDGVAVLASSLEGIADAETRWRVRLRVSPSVAPGELLLVLRGLFADGESVEVDGAIVVVPPAAASSGTFPWLELGAGVALALAFAAGGLLLACRRS